MVQGGGSSLYIAGWVVPRFPTAKTRRHEDGDSAARTLARWAVGLRVGSMIALSVMSLGQTSN